MNVGAILKWEKADQLSAVGVLYVVLALVLVHGRGISDGASSFLFFVSIPPSLPP